MPQFRYMLVEEDVPTVIVFNRFDIMRESFQGHYPHMTHFVHVYIYSRDQTQIAGARIAITFVY